MSERAQGGPRRVMVAPCARRCVGTRRSECYDACLTEAIEMAAAARWRRRGVATGETALRAALKHDDSRKRLWGVGRRQDDARDGSLARALPAPKGGRRGAGAATALRRCTCRSAATRRLGRRCVDSARVARRGEAERGGARQGARGAAASKSRARASPAACTQPPRWRRRGGAVKGQARHRRCAPCSAYALAVPARGREAGAAGARALPGAEYARRKAGAPAAAQRRAPRDGAARRRPPPRCRRKPHCRATRDRRCSASARAPILADRARAGALRRGGELVFARARRRRSRRRAGSPRATPVRAAAVVKPDARRRRQARTGDASGLVDGEQRWRRCARRRGCRRGAPRARAAAAAERRTGGRPRCCGDGRRALTPRGAGRGGRRAEARSAAEGARQRDATACSRGRPPRTRLARGGAARASRRGARTALELERAPGTLEATVAGCAGDLNDEPATREAETRAAPRGRDAASWRRLRGTYVDVATTPDPWRRAPSSG